MKLTINDVELSYETHGEGEPLLWLHGFMGAGADWRYLFSEPPAGYQLIAPDLRGHGASTVPTGAFSFRDAAHDVAALLDHLGIDRVKAIGLSGGGITLLHLATIRPAAVAAMVVVSAPPAFPAQARAIQRQFSASALSEQELLRMRQRHTGGDAQLDWLFSQVRAMADGVDDVAFGPASLATIVADTLIVFGDRDPLYPASLALELQASIPRAFLWIVPNGSHGPIFGDAAPRFVETTLAFFRGWTP